MANYYFGCAGTGPGVTKIESTKEVTVTEHNIENIKTWCPGVKVGDKIVLTEVQCRHDV